MPKVNLQTDWRIFNPKRMQKQQLKMFLRFLLDGHLSEDVKIYNTAASRLAFIFIFVEKETKVVNI